ncbi:DNA-binding transcriptional regulator [Lactobacillus sp. ESL0684]|uniref:sugar-binding transcriptional regulator n=1 Tax=unclassified Lactobacillus TaxID=2620435 RepID=UPI0023F7362A|nr:MULTISPECIES: sugar-binding domain-containing protein [unclassified Lactobacillus]WEV40737.1 DNA-binding transcriptional regulator [Lactobacillus sp. ESL0681]WEV44428.1 DNA-binding transcriptional regulator [Lactobacillus sp. ESL0684]
MTLLTDEELANIAHDYFLSKLNIADISKKYDLSRYLITKAIEEAEDKGIVKINIYQSPKRVEKLEREFQRLFHLKEVYILEDLETKNQDNEMIVNYAAKQIQNYIKSSHVVGLTWGTLIRDIVNNFTEVNRDDLTFIQLVGQVVNTSKRKNQVIQQAAKKFNAKSLTFPAPLYALNPQLIQEVKQEPFYEQIDNFYPRLDLVFASIGTAQAIESGRFFMEYYADSLFTGIDRSKIAGTVFGRPYDIEGNFFETIEPHICGISLSELMRIPNRFVIVKNRFKEEALLGALRSGVVTHLVTSSGIAERVLQKLNN